MDGNLSLSVSRSAQELNAPSKTNADGCTSSTECAASSKLWLTRETKQSIYTLLNHKTITNWKSHGSSLLLKLKNRSLKLKGIRTQR